jgi:hypothetical protein
VPGSLADFKAVLRRHYERKNQELGLPAGSAHEVFTVTAWGEIPTLAQLERDFPALSPASNFAALGERLRRWGAV